MDTPDTGYTQRKHSRKQARRERKHTNTAKHISLTYVGKYTKKGPKTGVKVSKIEIRIFGPVFRVLLC